LSKPSYLDLLARHGISSAHPGGMNLTLKLLETLQIDKDTRILDIGCGTGQTSAFIAQKYGCNITAIDINEEMLKRSYNRFRKEKIDVSLFQANAEELPFASQCFDILLSESVTAFTDINKSLKEYFRVLKHSGTLIAIEITSASNLDSNNMRRIKCVYNIDRIPTKREWINLFTESGFECIDSFPVAARSTNIITSSKMLKDFLPHLNVLRYYRKKLRYMSFICTKNKS
jgi:cyclopropane fatty-acyl-phospholipid synthase-like methyltransferase